MTFYINIINLWGSKSPWEAVWNEEYLGSTSCHKSVALRREFLARLKLYNRRWKKKHLRTIKVELKYPA